MKLMSQLLYFWIGFKRSLQFASVLAIASAMLGGVGIAQDDLDAAVAAPQSLEEVQGLIKEAGKLFKADKFQASAERVAVCRAAIQDLVLAGDRKDMTEWERAHRQLANAADALSIQGAQLPPMPEWKEIADQVRQMASDKKAKSDKNPVPAKGNEAEQISFTKVIAPMLVEHCGRCHVDKASGEFTMASYEQLAKGSKAGVVVFPGDPVSSPLISVVESGQMPPNGSRVPEEKLAMLKAWVVQGARYDGNDPKESIKSLVGETMTGAKAADAPVVVKAATGKETVSFSKDIAPLLVENCNGCHYMGNNAPGGLRFNNFSELLKGGGSGPAIAPGKAEDSLLVKKLLGTSGQRMPAGNRPPLSEDKIALVKTWISEGAAFDGDSQDSRLDAVIAKSWIARATHDELMERRMQRARENWQIVAPKSTPDEAYDEEVHVLGNLGKSAATKLLAQANQVAKVLRKQFKLSPKDSLIKGGITIIALKSRYDYSELGKMLEKRELPSEWSAHWKREAPDLYIAMVYDSSDAKLNETTLVQQMTSLWIASHDGAPKWFAEGAGRNALANTVGMNDARVRPWVLQFPEVVASLKTVKPILDGKMNDEDEAVLGFGIIRTLQASPLKSKYELILRQLANEPKFEDVFTNHLGPIEMFLKQSLGKW